MNQTTMYRVVLLIEEVKPHGAGKNYHVSRELDRHPLTITESVEEARNYIEVLQMISVEPK